MTTPSAQAALQALERIDRLIDFKKLSDEAHLQALRQFIEGAERTQAQLARAIEDRARFPDRPDDIGSMIGAHIGNLKVAAKTNEDAWRNALATADSHARESRRLLAEVKAWRTRFPKHYYRPQDDCISLVINAARSAEQKGKT
jgi:hypothetical protein